MNALTKLRSQNTGTWILAVLLALSMFGNYRTGGKLTRVCKSFTAMQEEHPAEWLQLLAENRPARRIVNTCDDYLGDNPYDASAL